MAWTYDGDPAKDALSKYRFTIGDTDSNMPILQDEEIKYLIDTYINENELLYNLFDKAAHQLAKLYPTKLGTSTDDPTSLLDHYTAQAKWYRAQMCKGFDLSSIVVTKPSFWVGMHDDHVTE